MKPVISQGLITPAKIFCSSHPILIRVKNGVVYCALCMEILGVIPNKKFFSRCSWTEVMKAFQKQKSNLSGQRFNGCISCGCTPERACPGGCSWIVSGKCSACFTEKGEYKPSIKDTSLFKELYV